MSRAPNPVWPWVGILLCTFVIVAVAAGGAFVASIWFVAASPQPATEPVSEPPAPQTEDSTPTATVSAVELWDAYGKKTEDADAKYKGKYIRVSGNVVGVSRDKAGLSVGLQVATGTALTLDELNKRPEPERRWHKEGFPPNVLCYAAPGGEAGLAALRRGDRVDLIGKVVGTKKADVWHGYVVVLESCRMVGPGKE